MRAVRCSALVPLERVYMRSRWSTLEPMCKRSASVEWLGEPLCLQHAPKVRGYCSGRETWFKFREEGWRCSCCRKPVRVVW